MYYSNVNLNICRRFSEAIKKFSEKYCTPFSLRHGRNQKTARGWLLFHFVILISMTSVVIAKDLELLDLVHSDVGICAEINDLENKFDEIKDSQIVNRFCKSLIYQEWRSSQEYMKVKKGREKIESIADRSINKLVADLFGKSTIIAFFPEDNNWDALLLTEAKDEETLKELINIWIETGSHETEELDFEGNMYHRRFRTDKDGSIVGCVYYIQHGRYFALSDSESRIQDVMNLYTIAGNEGVDSENFKRISLGYSEKYLSAKNSLSADCLATVYLNPEKIKHLIDRHLQNSKDFSSLLKTWNNLKSGIMGIRVDKNSFAVNMSLIQKEDSTATPDKEFVNRMQGESSFLSKVPQNALLAISGKIHLKNLESLVTELIENNKGSDDSKNHDEKKDLENVRQVSRGLLLGLDLFDDLLPALKPDWGAYLVLKEKPDLKTFPVDGLIAFELPENDTVVKNGGRISLKGAIDNGFNTGLNLLAAFYNSEKSGQPAVVRTEQSNASLLRWIDSIYSYLPSYGLNQQDLVIASHPDLIRDYVSHSSGVKESSGQMLSDDPTLQDWMNKYSRKENQWVILNLTKAHSYLSKHREFFIQHIMQDEGASEEKATKEVEEMTSISGTFDLCLFGLHMDKNELQVLFGVTCGK
jgi:hypothetical protein